MLKRSARRGEKTNATQSVKNVVEGKDRRDISRTANQTLLLYTSSSHIEEREQISVSIATSGVRLREQDGKPET